MLIARPERGPAAGLGHEVSDMLVNSCDQRQIIFRQFKRLFKCFRGTQARKNENKAKTDNVTSMMSVQQVHEFQNFGPMPLNTMLLADYKVYHNKTKFATRGDVVQVMFD